MGEIGLGQMAGLRQGQAFSKYKMSLRNRLRKLTPAVARHTINVDGMLSL